MEPEVEQFVAPEPLPQPDFTAGHAALLAAGQLNGPSDDDKEPPATALLP